jgi:hypothetical protein
MELLMIRTSTRTGAAIRDQALGAEQERQRRAASKRERLLSLPPIDPNRRYPLDLSSDYLGQSRGKTYEDIAEGRLKVIRDGKRRYIHGSELIRAGRADAAAAP